MFMDMSLCLLVYTTNVTPFSCRDNVLQFMPFVKMSLCRYVVGVNQFKTFFKTEGFENTGSLFSRGQKQFENGVFQKR